MSPYLAVISDSFLHAVRSKLLWVALTGWSIILLALSPFGFIEARNYKIGQRDIVDVRRVASKLTAASNSAGTSAQQALVNAMDEDTQQFWREDRSEERFTALNGRVLGSLNQVLNITDLYQPNDFPRAVDRPSLKKLLAEAGEDMDEVDLQERNRRLIGLALPGLLRTPPNSKIAYGYAGIKIGEFLPLTKKQAQGALLAVIFGFLQLAFTPILIFVSIVITAWLIPDTFQGGSLHLLLSKPISRSMLFLNKFIGGCTFAAIMIAFLMMGIYLIAGVRFGIWNVGLLYSIGVYIFAFAIFYSVSALTGVIWKNSIISIVCTAVFWLFCLILGIANGLMGAFLEQVNRIELVQNVDGVGLFSSDASGGLSAWDENDRTWVPAWGIGEAGDDGFSRDRVRGIFPLPESDKLVVAVGQAVGPFGPSRGGEVRMKIIDLTSVGENDTSTGDGNSVGIWSDARVADGPNFPSSTRRVRVLGPNLFVLAETGIYRLNAKDVVAQQEQQENEILNWLQNVAEKESDVFERLTNEDSPFPRPHDFAFSTDGSVCAVLYENKLQLLRLNSEGVYLNDGEPLVAAENDVVAGRIAISGDWILLGFNDQTPRYAPIYDLSKMVDAVEVGQIQIDNIAATDNTGNFAILSRDTRYVWWINSTTGECSQPKFEGQGDVTDFRLDSANGLIVAHSIDRVSRWQISDGTETQLANPSWFLARNIFKFAVEPFYTINPKPGAIQDIAVKLLIHNSDVLIPGVNESDIDYITPIWSNALFIAAMLALSCILLYRQDL